MIKTLRITTIIAAFLAIGLLSFPVVYGNWGDEEIEKFLKSPGAIEKFNKAKGAKVKTGDQVSPLVKQAVAFAFIINPPRVPDPKKPKLPPKARTVTSIPKPPGPISVKFTLIGTSYYASRPELSLAYINEPGKGFHWVRQGASVAHLTIEEVKDGSIVINDSEKTVTLAAVRAPKKSLIKGETTSTSTTTLPGASASITSSVPVAAGAGQGVVSVVDKTTAALPVDRRRLLQTSNSEQDADAAMADFINELKAQQAGAGTGKGGPGYSEAEKAELKEAIATFESMRITSEEANRLDRLGKELKQVQRSPARAGGSKVGKSGGPPPVPTRPPQSSPRPPQSPRRPPTRRPPSRPPK